jgi:cytoplasmic iron level regulating protein YaaA (DUF328/UPF0246 family)
MLIVLSPAKSLDYSSPVKTRKHSQPTFLDDAENLVGTLREFSPDGLSELMNISPKLGELNVERYANWQKPFNTRNARQAIFAFTGDVYVGLDIDTFDAADLDFAQKHLRILSGLYGVLRPLDLMQAYRLEMGTSLETGAGRNLYEFWGTRITEALNETLGKRKHPVLINLASNEYFRSVKEKALNADVITPVFKDYKNGQYKVISFFAKKARGMMAAWIIRNRVTDPDRLPDFDMAGYRYSASESTPGKPVFLRRQG